MIDIFKQQSSKKVVQPEITNKLPLPHYYHQLAICFVRTSYRMQNVNKSKALQRRALFSFVVAGFSCHWKKWEYFSTLLRKIKKLYIIKVLLL